jgi:hypothetical protein
MVRVRSVRPTVVLPILVLAMLVLGCTSTTPGPTAREASPIGAGAEATAPDTGGTGSGPTSTADPHGSGGPAGGSTPTPATTPPGKGTKPTSPAAGTSAAVPTPTDLPSDPDGVGDALFPGTGNPGIDVEHYDVDLTYDHASGAVRADVGMDIRFTERRSEFTLDSQGPQVDAVTIDDRAVAFEPDGGELRITPPDPVAAGTTAHVDVRYHFTGD